MSGFDTTDLGELPEHTLTREELLAARSRPPLTEADLPAEHRRNYKGAGSRPYKVKPRRVTSHGTVSGYAKGCRCIPCRNARRDYDRGRNAMRQARRLAS